MNKFATMLLTALTATVTLGISMNAFGFLGLGGTSWKEEVLLHDGTKIVVERNMTRHGRHEPGRKPPIGDQSIEFTVPGTSQKLVWRDEYSEDVGSANFTPIALHILNGTAYIIATNYGCLSYNKWGRPNPPYVIFRHDGKTWQRIQIYELPAMLTTINLVIGTSNAEKKLDALSTVPAAEIEKLNRDYRQPHYRTILREALKNAGGSCNPMVHYKCGWFGTRPDGTFNKDFADRMCNR